MCDNCLGTTNQGGEARADKRSRGNNNVSKEPDSASDTESIENLKVPSIRHKFITAGGRVVSTSNELTITSRPPSQAAPVAGSGQVATTTAPTRSSAFIKASKMLPNWVAVPAQKEVDEEEIDFYDDVRPGTAAAMPKRSSIISLDSDEE
jgi:hypothetical protein